MLAPGPGDYFFDEQTGKPAPSPFRFGEHVDNRALPAFANRRRPRWSREDRFHLNAGAGDDNLRFIGRASEPAGIGTALEPFLDTSARFLAQSFKSVDRNISHVLEHARPMPSDRVRVLGRSETNPK